MDAFRRQASKLRDQVAKQQLVTCLHPISCLIAANMWLKGLEKILLFQFCTDLSKRSLFHALNCDCNGLGIC